MLIITGIWPRFCLPVYYHLFSAWEFRVSYIHEWRRAIFRDDSNRIHWGSMQKSGINFYTQEFPPGRWQHCFWEYFLGFNWKQTPMGSREPDLCGFWKIVSQPITSISTSFLGRGWDTITTRKIHHFHCILLCMPWADPLVAVDSALKSSLDS